ncbi:tetratricopeptide repeat protein [Rhodobacteraceae bacterium NNCM2]|nr:tetratricopeptide repeat protein [Coraliihabitans acroporae]
MTTCALVDARSIPRPLPGKRAAAPKLLGFLFALILGTTPASADMVEDCAGADDPWTRLAACTEVIESGEWTGSRAGWAYSNRAVAHAALKNHLDAFDDHDKAIRLDPRNPRAWNNRATSHAAFREYDRALADYARALSLDPAYVNALVNRASVYDEIGRPADALADYDRAIELDAANGAPTDDLRFLRADAACQLGEVEASIADRMPAFESGRFPRDAMAEVLTNSGYLTGGASFDTALAEWTRAGCPWE